MNYLQQKLFELGASSLTDQDLFSMIVEDSGVAESVMKLSGGDLKGLAMLYPSDLLKMPGMTRLRASKIVCALEIGRRKTGSILGKTIHSSADAIEYMKGKLEDLPHEVFYIMHMNRGNKVLAIQKLSEGGMTGTVADPRLILRFALNYGACQLIAFHNHPSGNITPSVSDNDLTRKLKEGAALMDIKLLDHIIIASTGSYYSFSESGAL